MVNGHRQDRSVDQRVDDDLYVEHEKTDGVHKDVHQDINPAHAEAGILLRTAQADDILPAAGAPAPKHKPCPGASHDAADDAGRQVVVHKRSGRYGDNGEEHTLYADRDQRLYGKAPPQNPVAHVKKRYVHNKVDKARKIHPRRHRHVQPLDDEGPKQLGNTHKTAVVQAQRSDQHIDAKGKQKAASHRVDPLGDQFFFSRIQLTVHFSYPRIFSHSCVFVVPFSSFRAKGT